MPQVNEFSWYFISLKVVVLFSIVIFSFSFFVSDVKINNFKLNINYFSYMI